jgi:hypothetical protein
MDSIERSVLRRQTTAFIKDNPVSLTITRGGAKTSDGAGGWTIGDGTPIDPQTMRMIPSGEGRAQLQARNVDGEVITPGFVIIAEHDANIKKGDGFVKDNRNYEIIYVREDRRYETWAEVVYRG